MLVRSDDSFKRKKHQCPHCREIISELYIEQNPFPEFPCPSCSALIEAASLNNLELSTKDERRDERFDASLKVSYNSFNEFITEYTTNVSKGGIFINTKRHHEMNEEVELALTVPGLDNPLIIKGKVVRIKIHNVPEDEAGIGVQFTDMDATSRKALIEFINYQKKSK